MIDINKFYLFQNTQKIQDVQQELEGAVLDNFYAIVKYFKLIINTNFEQF